LIQVKRLRSSGRAPDPAASVVAQEAAAKAGASTPLGAQAEAMDALLDRLGAGGKDFSAILQLLRGSLP
jgi:hypothetical protein